MRWKAAEWDFTKTEGRRKRKRVRSAPALMREDQDVQRIAAT